jgi:hypothetical protein
VNLEEQQQEWREREAAENKAKDELLFAMRTRILTDEEVAQVGRYGEDLLIRFHGGSSGGYQQEDLERRMNEFYAQQFRLRAIASQKGE